jgi:hypothetical protein
MIMGLLYWLGWKKPLYKQVATDELHRLMYQVPRPLRIGITFMTVPMSSLLLTPILLYRLYITTI